MMLRFLSSSGVISALIVAAIVGAFVWHVIDRRAAYQDGQTAARLECAENAIAEAAKREAERLAAQEKIAGIEKRLLAEQGRANQLQIMNDVNSAVEKDKEDEKAAPNPGACYSGVSRRLRDAIDRAGR